MKIHFETKPKEWLWIAVLGLVFYLIVTGHVDQAINLIVSLLKK